MRSILHCDLNNFYASVATLTRPELREVPMVVGGDESMRHGVVLAKNEPAKRLGIQTGEPLFQARRKYPRLVVVPPEAPKYIAYSGYVREIYARYTDQVEPFGIDECYLDVTGSRGLFGGGAAIADALRDEVRRELGLTISVGVSFNRCFAKLGSDLKKPDGTTVISYEQFPDIVWPLPANCLLGVGRQTARKLEGRGIFTIGDIAHSGLPFMERLLGKNGRHLWRAAMGLDSDRVLRIGEGEPPKSIGRSATCARDLTEEGEVAAVLRELSDKVGRQLRREGMRAGGITVSVKDNTFAYTEYSTQLKAATHSSRIIADAALLLFTQRHRWQQPLRAVGVRAGGLIPLHEPEQLSFYEDGWRRYRIAHLEQEVDNLWARYGEGCIRPAARMLSSPISARFSAEVALPAFTKIDGMG